jgi:hypothetical protein
MRETSGTSLKSGLGKHGTEKCSKVDRRPRTASRSLVDGGLQQARARFGARATTARQIRLRCRAYLMQQLMTLQLRQNLIASLTPFSTPNRSTTGFSS